MNKPSLFVGTYTRNTQSEGIYIFDENFNLISVNGGIENPSFLALSPNKKVLYGVNEISDFEGKNSGALSAFLVGTGGDLRLLNQVASLGSDPCHLALASSGKFILVSNYSGGSLVSISVGEDGSLGECMSKVQHSGRSIDKHRQESAHVHSATLVKDNSRCYVADLGLDQILTYPIEADGQLLVSKMESVNASAGAGPRHMVFDGKEERMYLINELDNTIALFLIDKESNRFSRARSFSTLPSDFSGNSYCADIHLSRDGNYLYGSNRGHDSIAVFRVGEKDDLELLEIVHTGGKHPRNFVLSPDESQLVVANKDSDSIVVFNRNQETGRLEDSGILLQVPSPVFLQFY